MPPPPLVDDLIEEVLLRLPPDDPATLLRAALVCRAWCSLVSNRGFHRRFLEFHRSPHMLGFFHRSQDGTTSFSSVSPFRPPHAGCPSPTSWIPIEAWHGRVLFYDSEELELAVLNPITGEERRLPAPQFPHAYCGWITALACAAGGCGLLHCPFAPFVVVCLATSKSEGVTSACIYSSEAGAWRHISSVQHPRGSLLLPHSAFAGNALYFLFERRGGRILEYDLGRHELSVIVAPPVYRTGCAALVTANGGGLGFGFVNRKLKFHTCYKESAGPNGWVQHRVIELKRLLPVRVLSCLPLSVAFLNGADVIFIWTDGMGIFSIDLKSGLVTNVDATGDLHWIVPYRSFYTPGTCYSVCSLYNGCAYL